MDNEVIILTILFILSLIAITLSSSDKNKVTKELNETKDLLKNSECGLQKSNIRVEALEADLLQANNEIEQLSPFREVADVALEASRLKAEAAEHVEQLYAESKSKADTLIRDAEAQLILASEQHNSAALVVEKMRSDAQAEASNLINSAKSEAQEIAGKALEAKRNASSYAAAAKAMKNAIEGYGDEYIIPNHHALDDLADEYCHKEAGLKLKECRATTKAMISSGKAADCDYVERYRRNTAIKFVSDAFNGKVDTVMSRVKKDNFGKLKQQILDAFELVNHHGSAFKNARITDLFLQARINELKWAVATEELRLTEKAEQQAIKAQIRDEERARKEFEKAQREAEKEERLLEKAMEKARKELATASQAERTQYEQQLADLQQKWEQAEVRNQRAISMAQQTKKGHVYVISNIGSFGEDVVKVGMTRRLEPMDRVKELGDASVPFEFDVHAMIFSEDAPKLENELHRRFGYSRMNRVNLRKEFFRVAPSELKAVVDELGIEAQWTMKAEAAQYRESVAITHAEQDQVSA
ncbi:DUF4041 domain-containing protein [uncultured Ferrimonas sp.]|uniref:DUF4041 domain-containing protein n=1 Tax=uncultured Ferrimonas sp. TaxID=432640 RepID=UPI0026285A59|nr:DUF4041 domain-containing protein [uncultured Ferrimonas sp.]